MGMYCHGMSVTDEHLDEMLRQRTREWWIDYKSKQVVTAKPKHVGWLERLFGGRPTEVQETLIELDQSRGEGVELDIDKAWSGLNFLLTGEVWASDFPTGFLVDGGRVLNDDSKDFAVRGFRSEEAVEILNALKAFDHETLKRRYDSQAFCDREVYPALNWSDADFEEYLWPYFRDLITFLETCQNPQCGYTLLIG